MIDLVKLKSLIHGDVDASTDARESASHDASIFEIKPEVVVRPKNVEDIKNLVKFATEYQGINLAARSGGTDMSGGPLTTSIVVDFLTYFNQVKKIGDGYAVTQPGVYYRDFDKATVESGYIMPSYPASREICTVGGMVANNSGGEKTLTYGKTERYVRRLKMVCADGNEYEFKPLTKKEFEAKKKIVGFEGDIYRKMDELLVGNAEIIKNARPQVSKNSCGYYLWNVKNFRAEAVADKYEGTLRGSTERARGISQQRNSVSPHTSSATADSEEYFDLTKLIVGSQGTLGLITEIEFALIKPKKHSRLLVVFLKDLKQLAETAEHVLKFKPESFESFDDHTFKIAMKFLPQLIRQMGGNIFKFGLSFIPEVLAVLTGGVPKLILMAEFTADTPEEAVRMAEEAKESLRELHEKSRVTKTEDDAHKYWTMRRESFNMLRHHVKDLRTAPFIDDFAVLPARLPEFLPRLYTILDQYKLTYTIAGHIGDGNFHIIPLMNLREQHSHDVIKELSVKVYELVHEFGGTITAEHNDGLIRTPFVRMQFGDDVYALFEKTKKIWDPQGIFNPGKKVGTTWEQAVGKIVNK